MSIPSLQSDLKSNMAALAMATTTEELKIHLQHTLWPFLEALIDELNEIDEAVEEMVDEAPEVLHTESAEVFAALITSGSVLMTELKARAATDQRILRAIREWEQLARQGKEILEEITIPDAEDGEDEDDTDAEVKAAPTPPTDGAVP